MPLMNGFDAASHGVAGALQVGASVISLPGNFRRNRKEGQGTTHAALDATLDTLVGATLDPATYVVGMATRGLAAAAYRGFVHSQQTIRQVSTPFSQRFEHSQATARLQSYGLSRMGGVSGMGNEAANLYGRYGR